MVPISKTSGFHRIVNFTPAAAGGRAAGAAFKTGLEFRCSDLHVTLFSMIVQYRIVAEEEQFVEYNRILQSVISA